MGGLCIAYNHAMRHALLLAALCTAFGLASAQTTADKGSRPATARPDQGSADAQKGRRVERIRTQEPLATIDETRLGGETQSITVKPTANMPAYEVLPKDGSRSGAGNAESNAAGQGPRVWKFLNF